MNKIIGICSGKCFDFKNSTNPSVSGFREADCVKLWHLLSDCIG